MLEVILIELIKSDREVKEIVLILFFIVLFETIKKAKNERNNKSDNKK